MENLVCVTGASGFIASWLVKLLLESGYYVRGLVRSPDDKQKVGHLERLDGAFERLSLVQGDLLNVDSLYAAIDGCCGVFHIACPVPTEFSSNPEVEILDPAIKGTLNVLKACTEAKIKRVVMTSSSAAMGADPNRSKETLLDETCWSDEDYMRSNKYWYMLGKTLGEKAAWDSSQQNGLDLIVICPTLVMGALLNSAQNSSSRVVLKLLNCSSDSYENTTYGVVDVKDVARAHILAYETPAALGRYFCCREMVKTSTMAEIILRLFPNYTVPSRYTEVQRPGGAIPNEFSTRKVQDLGLIYTPLETTIKETMESLIDKGFLKSLPPSHDSIL